MKAKINFPAIFVSTVLAAAIWVNCAFAQTTGTSPGNLSGDIGSRYLFEQTLAQNNVTKIIVDSGEVDDFYNNLPNIGFTAGRRIIYNGIILLLDYTIHDSALAVLNKEELRLLRNTIYAKHGMIFQSDDLTIHFRQFGWYNPKSRNVEALLTEIDKTNIGKIQVFENAKPNLKLTKKDLARDEAYYPYFPVPSWCPELFIYNDNTIQRNGSYADYEDNWKGTYRIENGFLVVFVTEQEVSEHYSESVTWQWPSGVTYNNGKITFRTPIKMIFPVSEKIYLSNEYNDADYGNISYRRIGSVRWF
ncbi:MAG: YARHG domain-containing protein [Treponema sp.]|jgi:hypothetical protein|nr:YARHG domain-containing protein [Treponema sp.]